MIPKTRRLGKEEIAELFKTGQARSLGVVSILFAPSKIANARFALILPGKIKLTPVERNRIKRQLYPIIRQNLTAFPQHIDYAFRLSSRFINLTHEKRLETFQKAIKSLLSAHG